MIWAMGMVMNRYGNTAIPPDLFDEFLTDIAPQYTPETYVMMM